METMTGNADGVEGGPYTCALCGADITGKIHATAMVAHALDECRHRLRDQRDEMEDDRQVAVEAMLKTWSVLDGLDLTSPHLDALSSHLREIKEELRKALVVVGIEPMRASG